MIYDILYICPGTVPDEMGNSSNLQDTEKSLYYVRMNPAGRAAAEDYIQLGHSFIYIYIVIIWFVFHQKGNLDNEDVISLLIYLIGIFNLFSIYDSL